MTILHTEASLGWGGQEMRIVREAQGLEQRGWRVLLACEPNSEIIARATRLGLTAFPLRFNYSRAWSTIRALSSIIQEHNVDIVHTHSSLDSWLGAITARLIKRRVVRTRHLSTPIKEGLNLRLLYGYLTDAIISTSPSATKWLKANLGPNKIIECIATGVDVAYLEASQKERFVIRRKLNVLPEEVAVGTACVLRSWKGLEQFLHAAHLLRHLPARFFVFGGGPGLAYYRRLACEQFPHARIEFTGHIENIGAALAALDIFCLLSTAHEGFSQALLQAAFLKLPLVATPTDGLAQVCIDQKTGFIVPPFNAARVKEALEILIKNQALRERLGSKGHTLVGHAFTFDHTLHQIDSVLRRVRS